MKGFNFVPILVLTLISFVNGVKQEQNLKSCLDPVTCYLDSVEIAIPDFCQDVNGQSLCISGFACHGIFIESLPSSYIAPTTLGVGINGVGTYCAGDYSYGRLIEGTATALINDTNVGVDLFVGKENEFPISTDFATCGISSMNVEITFSSSGLDDLAPALEEVIKKAVNALVCVGMKNFFAVNVTNAIVNTIDPRLKELIASPATPLPLYNPHYMTWSDSIVSKIHKLVDAMDGLASGGDFLQCIVEEAPYLIHDLLDSQTRKVLSAKENRAIFVDLKDKQLSMSVDTLLAATLSSVGLQSVPAMNSSISLDSLSLIGFDSMNAFELLDPMTESNVTLHTKIGFDSLEIEIGLTFTTTSINNAGEPLVYSESLLVRFKTHDVFVLADVVLAVNDFVLKSFFLDQLSSPACWLSTLTEFSIADLQLHLNVDELSITQVEGSAGPFEKDIIALLNNAVLLLTQGFGPLLTDTLNGVMQGPVRTGVNTKIADSLVTAKQEAPCLSHYPYYDTTDYIVWADNAMIQMVNLIVNEKVGYAGVNKVMNCATNNTGELTLNTSHLHIKIAGLNSFYALRVLAPITFTKKTEDSSLALLNAYNALDVTDSETAPYELQNELGLGFCSDSLSADPAICNPLRVIIASYDTETAPTVLSLVVNEIVKQFKIVMSLDNLDVFLDLLLKIDKNGMRDLTFGQTGTTGCKETTMESFSIQAMQIALSAADVSINDGAHSRNITNIVSRVLDTITRAEKVATRNANMAEAISNSEATCAQSSAVNPSSTDDNMQEAGSKNNEWKWEMAVLCLSCITCLICLLWAYSYWGQAQQLNTLLEQQKESRQEDGAEPSSVDVRTLWDKLDCSNTLVFHSKVPMWLQIALPIVIIGNMGMFLNSNLIPDAVSVMVEIDYKTTVITPDSVFDFGLASTVHDMWEAGVYPLAILIAFFSGAWPYVKLASMLVAWVVPPGLLSVPARESVLTWLDVLGKWSLIDFFVMILMLCAFFFELHIGPEMLVKVTVLPKWGFYGFLLATMISLGLGHIILACHRLVVEHKVLPLPDMYSPKESLASMTYTVYLEEHDDVSLVMKTVDTSAGDQIVERAPQTVTAAESRRAMYVKLTTAGTSVIVSLIFLTGFFVVAGTFIDTMTFEFKGMVGLMLKEKSEVDYSFVSVGVSVPEHSGIPNDFAIRWMQGSFFLFGLAMPLALMISLLVLWVVPMSIAKQRQLFVLTEVLNAWSTLDVYSVSIIAALLEIQQFAMFIVGDSCDGINKMLENFDEALEGDDKCFDVVAVLKTECWTIFLAACLIIVVGLPSLNVCHIAIKHRMQQSEEGLFDHVARTQSLLQEEGRSFSKDGKRQNSQADGELCKPLLEDVPLHDNNESTQQSKQSVRSLKSASGAEERRSEGDNTDANSVVSVAAPRSFWSRLSCHAFNVSALTLFARMNLVEITSVDRNSLYYRQQMLELQQDQEQNQQFLDASSSSPLDHHSPSPLHSATPQVVYSDIYSDSTPNKDGRNVMVTSETF